MPAPLRRRHRHLRLLLVQRADRSAGGLWGQRRGQLITLKKGQKLRAAYIDFGDRFGSEKSYRKNKLPASGVLLEEKDIDIQQLKIDTE